MAPSRFRSALAATALLTAAGAFARDADPPAPGDTVTVTAARVTATPEPASAQPARVVRITRAEISASGAQTLPQLLARVAGIDLYDQTGSGRDLSLSLRGQPDRNGATLLYGGIPLNAADDRRADLFLVPLSSLEAVEVYFGGAPYGDGQHSAVINLVPRASTGLPMLDVTLRAGDTADGGRDLGGRLEGGLRVAGWDFALALERESGRGFRENGAFHETLSDLRAARKAWGGEFAFTAGRSAARYGQPGALTRAEMDAGGSFQDPYNRPDYSDVTLDRFGAGWEGPLAAAWRARAELFRTRRDTDALSTGRFAASPFGYGLRSTNAQTAWGTAGSLEWRPADALRVSGGWEWRRETVGLRGYSRDAAGAPLILFGNSSDEISRAASRWSHGGLFVRVAGSAGKRLDGELTLRRDASRLVHRDPLQSCDPSSAVATGGECRRSFDANGYRAGLTAHAGERVDFFLAQSEGHSLPSIFDLYAYPLFGSNPALRPERSRTREAGARWRGAAAGAELTLFRTDFEGEVQFVLTDPFSFTGENRNVGRSRREGAELAGWWSPAGTGLTLRGGWTRTDARYRPGTVTQDYSLFPPVDVSLAGRRVPLVPRDLFTAGVRWTHADFSAGLDWRRRGRSVLDNDLTNDRWAAGAAVPASSRFDVTAGWDAARWRAVLRVDNLLDDRRENRGITNGATDFFTPAQPRRIALDWTLKLP